MAQFTTKELVVSPTPRANAEDAARIGRLGEAAPKVKRETEATEAMPRPALGLSFAVNDQAAVESANSSTMSGKLAVGWRERTRSVVTIRGRSVRGERTNQKATSLLSSAGKSLFISATATAHSTIRTDATTACGAPLSNSAIPEA